MNITVDINDRHIVRITVSGQLTAENFAFLRDLWELKETHDDAVAEAETLAKKSESAGK